MSRQKYIEKIDYFDKSTDQTTGFNHVALLGILWKDRFFKIFFPGTTLGLEICPAMGSQRVHKNDGPLREVAENERDVHIL